MKYQYFGSFILIFILYNLINKCINVCLYTQYSETNQITHFTNSLKYLFFHPRTHGSNAFNSTYTSIDIIMQQLYNSSNYSDSFQLLPFKYNPAFYSSSNSFRMYTIHNDINTSIFYFHKTNGSTDIINFTSSSKNARKSRRKNILQNIKTIKQTLYHNNTKPLIIFCRIDTNPSSPSTYDSTIHIFAILEAVNSILSSKKISNKIKHDFAIVFTGCDEFDQLSTKNLMKNIFKDGGYYLYLSGVGVGRPFTLYSQSNKSSSVIKALSKVKSLPMATFISEFEDLISLIKAKSYSMSKIKHNPKTKSKNIYNSNSEKSLKDKTSSTSLNLAILKKRGNEKEIHRYKYRYRYVNGATKIQKNKNFSGAELSFIGNSLFHLTPMDVDNDKNNINNIQLVVNCILQFLTHFNPNSGSNIDDISKESYLVAFGISPFVFLIQKETLNLVSFGLILFFCLYVVFYLILQILYNLDWLNSNQEKMKSIEKVAILKSIISVFVDEFSFVFYFFLALISTFIFYMVFFLLLSVMNPSSMISMPILYFFLIVFSIFSVFIYIFEYLIDDFKHKKPSSVHNYNINYYLYDDWHFLQVIYMTILLIIFRKFDFEILIVETAIFFIILQFCPIHKNMKWMPVVLSLLILSPLIFAYSLLYNPFLLDCQNLPIFYADIVPFIFIFLFFIHMSVFILPFYFTREKQNGDLNTEIKPERLKIHYLCAISQIYLILGKINFSSFVEDEISEMEKKISEKKSVKTNEKVKGFKNRNKLNKSESSSNSNNKSNKSIKTESQINITTSLKTKIETIISSKILFFINFINLFFLIFFISPSFSRKIPIKGTFSHYFIKDSDKSEISFVPKSGRRSIPFIWKSLSKSDNYKYIYNYKGRLLTGPEPAIVQIIENSTLPFFFMSWPQISLSSIQHDIPTYRPVSFESNDENENNEVFNNKKKIVRKIIFNLNSMGPNVNFIYFIFKCGSNSIEGQCVDSRLSFVDPIDLTTISYSSMLKNEEKLLLPFLSRTDETVFRIGSFIGFPMKKVPHIEINVTKNTPIKLTIAYQSFIETKEMKDFKSKFNNFAINEINENEITQSVFIQTQMI